MAKMSCLKFLLVFYMVICSFTLLAYQSQQDVDYYKSDNVTNQIPYFDNRFRLDAQLEEITLIFYRRSGTPPIILVQPDGSKIKINDLPEGVKWFDDRTFDMIKIKKPMPGPWQAVGDILPESKIMVVSEVTIAVEPIPEIVLAGETLKMTGRLINGDRAITDPTFRDVINLDVDFYSTNNSSYDNFGAEPIQLTTFRDDGEELDEYSNDGIFTGEFALNFAPGEWVPVYLVKMPMATRELRQKPIIVQKNPITISVEPATEDFQFHNIIFSINPDFVDPDSVIFQGKYILPDRHIEPFSIVEGRGKKRIEKLAYTEAGIHRVNVNVFGKTKSGREFRLVVPEFVFNIERFGGVLVPTLDENGLEIIGMNDDSEQVNDISDDKEQLNLEFESSLAELTKKAEDKQTEMLLIIGIANITIIILALITFYFMRRRKIKV